MPDSSCSQAPTALPPSPPPLCYYYGHRCGEPSSGDCVQIPPARRNRLRHTVGELLGEGIKYPMRLLNTVQGLWPESLLLSLMHVRACVPGCCVLWFTALQVPLQEQLLTVTFTTAGLLLKLYVCVSVCVLCPCECECMCELYLCVSVST